MTPISLSQTKIVVSYSNNFSGDTSYLSDTFLIGVSIFDELGTKIQYRYILTLHTYSAIIECGLGAHTYSR